MALIVVGGQTKHVGKTTLVCEIIRHFVSAGWTAVKITSHFHEADDCTPISSGSDWRICEQAVSDTRADTARYLLAGAVRALLVCAESGSLPAACSALKREVLASANLIVESTTGAEVLAPDMFLLVVDPKSHEFKPWAREQLARAHRLVVSPGAQRIGLDTPEPMPIVQAADLGIDAGLVGDIERLLRTHSSTK